MNKILKYNPEKPLYKVKCPFCKASIRPKSAYCSMCAKLLAGVDSFIFSEEEVDLDETILFCKFCENDVSWADIYCRTCGRKLRG